MQLSHVCAILLTSLLTISTAYADGFDPTQLDFARNYSWDIQDPFVSSVVGTCNLEEEELDDEIGEIEEEEVTNSNLDEGEMPYLELLVKDENGEFKRNNKTIFFMPGVFTRVSDESIERVMKIMAQDGYHVIGLPNPFSVDYVEQGPKHFPGDAEAEAESYYQTIQRLHRKYKSRGLFSDQVRVIGISYGAFVTAVMSSVDSTRANPLFKDVTLLAPPHQMYETLMRLDEYTEETEKEFGVMNLATTAKRAFQVCRNGNLSDIPLIFKSYAKALVAQYAFKRPFISLLKAYKKSTGRLNIPPRANFLAYKRWKRDVSFSQFLNLGIARDVKQRLQSERGLITYWLEQAQRNRPEFDYRIVTADDDFLNEPGDWNAFVGDQLILLPYGGHYGFRSDPWLKQFLQLAF